MNRLINMPHTIVKQSVEQRIKDALLKRIEDSVSFKALTESVLDDVEQVEDVKISMFYGIPDKKRIIERDENGKITNIETVTVNRDKRIKLDTEIQKHKDGTKYKEYTRSEDDYE